MLRHTSCPSKRYRAIVQACARAFDGLESSGNDDGRTCHVLEFLRGASGNGEESGKYNQGKSAGHRLRYCLLCGRNSESGQESIFPFRPKRVEAVPRPYSLGFPRPRQPQEFDTLVIGSRNCEALPVITATRATSLYLYLKKEPIRALFFQRQVIRTDPFQY